jgi:hypothetical protein
MVQTGDLRQLDNLAHARRLDSSWLGRILSEREMGSRPVVVGEVGSEDAKQVTLAENDKVIEAFTSHGTHKALCIWVLPGRPWRCQNLVNAQAFDHGEA